MNRTLNTLLLILTITFSVNANTSLQERLQSPVYIVMETNDEVYNESVTQAVENYWEASAYTFITKKEYETAKGKSQNIFLIKNENQAAEDEGTMIYEDVMKLVYFVKKGRLVYTVAGTPILDENNEMSTSVINAVRVLQDKLHFMMFKEEKNTAFASYDKEVKSKTSILKVKTLYIVKEDIDATATLEEIAALYDGDLKIVTKEELQNIVNSKTDDALYIAINNRKTSNVSYVNTKQVFMASTGELIYNEETTSIKPQGLTKKDMKELSE
ncbi:MAG: hypothetical protein H7Y00_15855 [Fimbriimonadaceae bacterium]|nr:hypothetical protein [Chitinophagales bacterium]